jgi:hypothetical protein
MRLKGKGRIYFGFLTDRVTGETGDAEKGDGVWQKVYAVLGSFAAFSARSFSMAAVTSSS